MALQNLTLASTWEFTAYATYDDADGDLKSITGVNASPNREYTITAFMTRPNRQYSTSWLPGVTRTDTLPNRIAKYGTVEDGTLIFDGRLEMTARIV